MTTGNKPTAGAAVPVARLAGAEAAAGRRGRAALRHASASCATARPAWPATSAPAYNPFVVEGAGGGQRRTAAPTLRVRGITLPTGFTLEDLENRDQLLAELRQRLRRRSTSPATWSTASTPSTSRRSRSSARDKTKKAFDLEPRSSRASATATAPTPFGQGALAARRLVEAGRALRHRSASAAGTRTARTSTPSRRGCCRTLDQTLSALIDDLDDRGMLDSTIVMLRRRVRPHAEDQQERRPRPLGAVDGGACWPAAASSAATPTARTDASGMAPATDPVHAGRRRRDDLPPPRHRPAHGTADPDRPADQPLPRGQGDREASGCFERPRPSFGAPRHDPTGGTVTSRPGACPGRVVCGTLNLVPLPGNL